MNPLLLLAEQAPWAAALAAAALLVSLRLAVGSFARWRASTKRNAPVVNGGARARLLGRVGRASGFSGARGRIRLDGAEHPAVLDDGDLAPLDEASLRVVRIGAEALVVRPLAAAEPS